MSNVKIKGIDVSRWQADIDWAKVKKDGVEFAVIKAAQEAGFIDSYFKANIEGAQKNGIKAGVYHYSKALNTVQAQAEANFMLNVIKGYALDYPIAFDIEDYSQQNLGKKIITDIILAYFNVIKKAGRRVMLYTNTNWRQNYIDMARLGDVIMWQAHYPPNPDIKPAAIDDKVSIWQYSSTGKVAGINGNVDMNWGFVDLSEPNIPEKPSSPLIGDPLGDVLYSNITAYINGYAVPSSVADDKTLVCAEDLANYGFDVVWNEKDRTLDISLNKNKAFKPLAVEKLPPDKKSGDFKCKYIYTDIRTYLSGGLVQSYAVNGRMLFDFELLKKYGKVTWDEKSRELRLNIN